MKKLKTIVAAMLLCMASTASAQYLHIELNDGTEYNVDRNDIKDVKIGVGEDADFRGVKFVDMGLSVHWATCNVGAETPDEAGLYFAWADTRGYSSNTSDGKKFDWASYTYVDKEKLAEGTLWLTKYCTGETEYDYGKLDNKRELLPEDDAANVAWGGDWSVPTEAEFKELMDENNCEWEWTTYGHFEGYKVTSKLVSGAWIFLPAAGYRTGTKFNNENTGGRYWSKNIASPNPQSVRALIFKSSNVEVNGSSNRYEGYTIRPVIKVRSHR